MTITNEQLKSWREYAEKAKKHQHHVYVRTGNNNPTYDYKDVVMQHHINACPQNLIMLIDEITKLRDLSFRNSWK